VTTLLGHTDAIWDFKLLPDTAPFLASASADGTVKLWNTEDEQLQWSWDQPFGSKGKKKKNTQGNDLIFFLCG
jgi:striatin 1/3/4